MTMADRIAARGIDEQRTGAAYPRDRGDMI